MIPQAQALGFDTQFNPPRTPKDTHGQGPGRLTATNTLQHTTPTGASPTVHSRMQSICAPVVQGSVLCCPCGPRGVPVLSSWLLPVTHTPDVTPVRCWLCCMVIWPVLASAGPFHPLPFAVACFRCFYYSC